ncbi:MAG: AMP-binding protein [Deltaproteobacteria bacterium]|jgi:phenylacetate-coenzyme A ligase PaaK-like adenylate-forming protein|nr:AMP-binding protein [Deltaproteobacteria bacterium]
MSLTRREEPSPRNPLDLQFLERLGDEGGENSDPALLLALFRLEKLALTLERATVSSAFYRRRLGAEKGKALAARLREARAAGTAANREKTLQSVLAEIPLTSPEDLAARPESFLAVSHSEVEGVISIPSSGSSGLVKRVYSAAADLENSLDFFRYGMRCLLGSGTGERVALLMSGERPGSVGDLLTRAMRRLGAPCLVPGFPPGEAEAETAWLRSLSAWAPTCLVGVPGTLLALARHSLAPELARSVRSILLSGDAAPDSLLAALKEAFGAEVFRHYGLTEFGLGGAVECGAHSGPHLREADILAEVLDPAGLPCPPGEPGEIVLTSLSRLAMPLLRYRTGDAGAFAPGSCPCGSVMRRLLTFGRLTDRILTPAGHVLSLARLSESVCPLPFVRDFRFSFTETPHPRLTLEIAGADGRSSSFSAIRAALAGLPGLDELETDIRLSPARNLSPNGKRILYRRQPPTATLPG